MLDLEIAPQEVAFLLREAPSSLMLLDVREPWEIVKARIQGAKEIPMGDIPARVFEELDPEARIVAFCHAGVRSLNVALWMRSQGFENVQSMRRGIDGWSLEIDRQVARY